MLEPTQPFEQLQTYLWVIIIIGFGALANAMDNYLLALKDNKKNSRQQFFANLLLAAFGGLIGWLVSSLLIDNEIVRYAIAWLSAYAGVKWLNKIRGIVLWLFYEAVKTTLQFISKTKEEDDWI